MSFRISGVICMVLVFNVPFPAPNYTPYYTRIHKHKTGSIPFHSYVAIGICYIMRGFRCGPVRMKKVCTRNFAPANNYENSLPVKPLDVCPVVGTLLPIRAKLKMTLDFSIKKSRLINPILPILVEY